MEAEPNGCIGGTVISADLCLMAPGEGRASRDSSRDSECVEGMTRLSKKKMTHLISFRFVELWVFKIFCMIAQLAHIQASSRTSSHPACQINRLEEGLCKEESGFEM